VIIDDKCMYNYTTIIHKSERTIYNGSAIIKRNGGVMSTVRQRSIK